MKEPKPKRCAIYCRKSTLHGLDTTDFSSLDAQRESAEAYITSQALEGWVCLPEHYDDRGYSGGNLERPALQQLLTHIQEAKIDVIVVSRVDRLTRSLLSFCKLMELFEKFNVSFVSVTQHFNTSNSMGRLTVHILLSFAQYERELIAERTRDKSKAARRRGKWTGGRPPLGYDLRKEPNGLVVNSGEADRIRQIFSLYREHQSIIKTLNVVTEKGWKQKTYLSRKGIRHEGQVFSKSSLHRLLTNPTYVGKVRHDDQIYEGQHEAIIDEGTFDAVQQLLSNNRQNGCSDRSNRDSHALLRSLLVCQACKRAMTPSHTRKPNGKVYRYYLCTKAAIARKSCPNPSLPAGEIESFVINTIVHIGHDADLQDTVWQKVNEQSKERIEELSQRAQLLKAERLRIDKLTQSAVKTQAGPDEFSILEDQLIENEREFSRTSSELSKLRKSRVSKSDVVKALRKFSPVWDSLPNRDRSEFLRLIIQSVSYDGPRQQATINFHSQGLRSLLENANR